MAGARDFTLSAMRRTLPNHVFMAEAFASWIRRSASNQSNPWSEGVGLSDELLRESVGEWLHCSRLTMLLCTVMSCIPFILSLWCTVL